MLPEAVALGAETRNLGFGTLQAYPKARTGVFRIRFPVDMQDF